MRYVLAPVFALILATPAAADIRVAFDEGAPVDRFTVLNAGTCPLGAAVVTIDLAGSAGRLIFDVTGAGAGIEVFQPFRVVAGGASLTALPTVSDGDRAVALGLHGLGAGERVAFTIDVDDTTSARGIMVAGSEIEGASVRVEAGGEVAEGRFGRESTARVAVEECAS